MWIYFLQVCRFIVLRWDTKRQLSDHDIANGLVVPIINTCSEILHLEKKLLTNRFCFPPFPLPSSVLSLLPPSSLSPFHSRVWSSLVVPLVSRHPLLKWRQRQSVLMWWTRLLAFWPSSSTRTSYSLRSKSTAPSCCLWVTSNHKSP